ncbi:hypothetical protein [Endozoicomonas sp. ONNA1]|uniref:hypothetical protein n=1 Tax=Endozoicomonas sp. ONNA1 TaxID=2828740 RepID=UPI00214953D2|nr:hypothetical protein [Endozoicomonas sp. ONNA1]
MTPSLTNTPNKSLVQQWVIRMLSQLLTARMKRVFFSVTLFRHLSNVMGIDNANRSRLHQSLLKNVDRRALAFPEHFANNLWCHLSKECAEDLVNNNNTLVSDNILDVTPQWLLYGRRGDMIRDINVVVNTLKQCA